MNNAEGSTMKKQNKLQTVIYITQLSLAILILASCTKSRPAAFSDYEDENLMSIEAIDGKEFPLTTEKEIAKLNSSNSDKVSTNTSQVQNFNLVKYQTEAKLMDSVPFTGKENSIYKIRYELTDSYLKVFKIAKKDLISMQEMSYAEKLNDGTFKVPLIGYPIEGYYQVKRAKNELKEETSRLTLKRELTKSTASHFKINPQGKEVFKAISKINTFPAEFFEGDWYYAETISALNYAQSKSSYGAMISADQFGNEAAKVRFKKTENALTFFNLNIDDKLNTNLQQREENQGRVISIPAKWIQYKQSDRGTDKAMAEEEDQNPAWTSRSFVQLNLSAIESAILGRGGQNEIRDIQITDDYFSFTTIAADSNMKIKHSLLRAKKSSYESKVYYTTDRNVYGFFFSNKNVVTTPDRYKEKDFESLNLVNRYNPKSEKIEFRLSEQSPAWSQPIAEEAVRQWNEAFKKAGLKTEVVFNAERAQLGDIRYNVLNLLSQPDDKFSWGGYGPSVNDPQTGERIASTANVNLNDTLNFLVEIMRRMKDAQLGLLDKAYILGSPLPSVSYANEDNTKSLDVSNTSFLKRTTEVTGKNGIGLKLVDFKSSQNNRNYGFQKLVQAEKTNIKLKYKAETIISSYGNIIDDINKNCEEVRNYISNLNSNSVEADSQTEFNLFMNCALKVSPERIVSVLLHEMGHNLGLRHNFYGSVDVANFISKHSRTSSVMEYTTSNEDRGGIGPYDIAAIRWAYAGMIEDKNGNLIQLTGQKSILDEANDKNISMKKYMFCTDENVDVVNVDPMCARSDSGTTPLEVVSQKIKDYNTSIAVSNQRRNRKNMPSAQELSISRLENYLLPLKSFYDYWRVQVASYAGQGNEYLENYTEEQYSQLLDKMSKDEKYKYIYAQYKPAADLVYSFFKMLAFLPDKYCVGQREATGPSRAGQKETRLYSFSQIKETLFNSKSINVNSCKDAEVQEYLKTVKKVTYLGEGGYSVDDQYYDLNVTKGTSIGEDYSLKLRPDVIGMQYERANAFAILSERAPMSFYSKKMNFYPNFFDEPARRIDMENVLLSRLTSGVDLKFFTKNPPAPGYSLNFMSEKHILSFYYDQFKMAHIIPGKDQVNNERMTRFSISLLYSNDLINSFKEKGIDVAVTQSFGQYYYASEKNDIAYRILKNLEVAKQVRTMKRPEFKVVQFVTDGLKAILPSQSSVKNMTFDDYLAMYQSIVKLGNQLEKTQNSETNLHFFQNVVNDYSYVVQAFNSYIQGQQLTDEKKKEFIGEYVSKSFMQAISTLNTEVIDSLNKSQSNRNFPRIETEKLTSENVNALISNVLYEIDKVYKVYDTDKEDYDAAIDLLTSTLR